MVLLLGLVVVVGFVLFGGLLLHDVAVIAAIDVGGGDCS